MRDSMNNTHNVPAITPVVVSDNTAQVSAIIDTRGYDGLTFVFIYGTIVDADCTLAVTMDHGDVPNLSDAAAVPASALLGTLALAGATFADDTECRKVGYVGSKRYVRVTVTPSANASAIPMACIANLRFPNIAPTANPPQ